MAEKRKWKVKKKSTGGPREYRKWDEWDSGDTMVARLLSTGIDKFKKKNWIVDVLEANFEDGSGKKLVGKKFCFNHCGSFEREMDKIELNEVFQVEYNGKEEIKGGDHAGEEAHSTTVDGLEDPDAPESDEDDADDEEAEDAEESDDDEELDL